LQFISVKYSPDKIVDFYRKTDANITSLLNNSKQNYRSAAVRFLAERSLLAAAGNPVTLSV
jgi:hypothetical protein